ncbi:MAG: hypothetical protein QM692_13955 [Thermomicrobiales bacterium]
MEDRHFDEFVRTVSGSQVQTRRAAVAALLGGLLAPLLPGAETLADRGNGKTVASEKKRKRKRCAPGLLTCVSRKGRKKQRLCVDGQRDPANCGACGSVCGADQSCQGGVCTGNAQPCAGCRAGDACVAGTTAQQCGAGGAVCQTCPGDDCNEPVCITGVCDTTPLPGKSCDGGAGTCDAAGLCQPQVCVGRTSANPCFPLDASTCNASGSTCHCGTDINGINGCYQNAYCNNPPAADCTSNADCEPGFGKGSLCFNASGCCGGRTGCTTPCPNPIS